MADESNQTARTSVAEAPSIAPGKWQSNSSIHVFVVCLAGVAGPQLSKADVPESEP